MIELPGKRGAFATPSSKISSLWEKLRLCAGSSRHLSQELAGCMPHDTRSLQDELQASAAACTGLQPSADLVVLAQLLHRLSPALALRCQRSNEPVGQAQLALAALAFSNGSVLLTQSLQSS